MKTRLMLLISITLMVLLTPFTAMATPIAPVAFGPGAVTESFEGFVTTSPLILTNPTAFASGVVYTGNAFSAGIEDASLGATGCFGLAPVTNIPDGTAFICGDTIFNTDTYKFSVPAGTTRVGVRTATTTSPSLVELRAYDATNTLLETVSYTDVAGTANWPSNFLGIEQLGGIAWIEVATPSTSVGLLLDTVVFEVTNTAPIAVDDPGGLSLAANFTTDEDTPFTTADVTLNDTDPDVADTLSVCAFDTTGTVGTVTANAGDSNMFDYDPNGQFEGLGTGESATDTFTYKVDDGHGGGCASNAATVTITITGVNDAPVMGADGVRPSAQTSDYSDNIGQVVITATDVDSPTANGDLTLAQTGAPLNIPTPGLNSTASCSDSGSGQSCSWTMDGQVDVAASTNNIDFTASDNEGADSVCSGVSGECRHVLTVHSEDATIELAESNPVSVQVSGDGDPSGPFSLWFSGTEAVPDASHDGSPESGNLNKMAPYMTLVPVGPGGPETPVVCDWDDELTGGPDNPKPNPADEYDQVAYFQCDFDGVPVNTYEIDAGVLNGYYTGSDEGVLVVYDPSLGFTTGGGFFYWPDTCSGFPECDGEYLGDKTNFGFTFKYNKKQKNIHGSLLMMRHTPAGNYKLKSNALDGMGLGDQEDAGGTFGWAAVSGKITFQDPTGYNTGGNPFLMYVEDHGEQGCNQDPIDEIWIEVDAVNVWTDPLGPDPTLDAPSSGDATDAGDDVPIFCGNIVVPISGGGGGHGHGRGKPPK